MPQKQTVVPVSGLATKPNNLSEVPAGSLKVADNVVIRRKGVLEPAPTTDYWDLDDITDSDKTILKSMADAGDDFVCSVIRADGSGLDGAALQIQNNFTSESAYFRGVRVNDATSAAQLRRLQFKPGRTHSAYSRDRRIFSGEQSCVTCTKAMNDIGYELRTAGLQAPGGVRAAQYTYPPESANIVAPMETHAYYRAVFLRKYPKYELVSAPTAPFLYENLSDTTDLFGLSVRVNFCDETTPSNVGDIVVLYRTPFVSLDIDPGDAYQECGRFTMTITEVQGGQVRIFDLCPNENLGDYLYTNSTQEGLLKANLQPPDSRCVVTYNDTTFYVMNRDWSTMSFGINDFGNINDGATVGTYNGTNSQIIAAGSNAIVVAGDSSIADLFVPGMVVCQGDINTGAIGTVVSATSDGTDTTITIEANYGLAGTITGGPLAIGSTTFYVSDSIVVTGRRYGGAIEEKLYWFQSYDPWQIPYWWAANNSQIRAINVSSVEVKGEFDDIVNLTLVTSQVGWYEHFDITVTHGRAYTRMDDTNTDSAFKASVESVSTSRVYWSKTSLPEAVGALQYFDVGHGNVLRGISDNNGLYFAASDGVYRVTGAGDDWQVVQLSRSHRLVHADAMTNCSGRVFGWFSEGACYLNENGLQNVSEDAIGPTLSDYAFLFLADTASVTWGTFMAAFDIEQEVFLTIGFYDGSSWSVLDTFALNLDTFAWVSRSSLVPQSATYVPNRATLYFAKNVDTSTPQLHEEWPQYGWEDPSVVFNPFNAGAPGMLKQWVDLNLLIDDEVQILYDGSEMSSPANVLVQFLFDNDTPGVVQPTNFRWATEHSLQREHCWVPKRAALRDKLTAGFSTLGVDNAGYGCSVYFRLQGVAVRYRVASQTFQK